MLSRPLSYDKFSAVKRSPINLLLTRCFKFLAQVPRTCCETHGSVCCAESMQPFFVETSSQTILRNWSPACLLNCGSSTVFKGIFRAACARYTNATPLSYNLMEPPSLLQIDSKNPLGVQRMGLPHCSTALSEPFVLDRCRTSPLFDATSKSHANRFQRSVGFSNSASSMLFQRIFRAACARFIDATPLSCDLTEPPSLLQTAIAYLNRASSMSFIFLV